MTLHSRWSWPTRPEDTLVVAHRGAWGAAGENTLEAFEAAIELGADMIEFDVRRTGDGRLIVSHDPTFDHLPLASVRYDALAAGGAAPPPLEEVLALARGRITLDVELKERGCVEEVVPLLERFGLDRCLLSSFHDDVVRAAKAAAPALTTGLIIGYRNVADVFPAARARRAGADVVVLHDWLTEAGARGHGGPPCLVWTVNRPPRLNRHLADPRVCGVITDVPAVALAQRARLSERSALRSSGA